MCQMSFKYDIKIRRKCELTEQSLTTGQTVYNLTSTLAYSANDSLGIVILKSVLWILDMTILPHELQQFIYMS